MNSFKSYETIQVRRESTVDLKILSHLIKKASPSGLAEWPEWVASRDSRLGEWCSAPTSKTAIQQRLQII